MQYTVRNPLALAYEPMPVRLSCEISASWQDARLPEELVFGNKESLQLDARGMILNIIGDIVREEHVSLDPRLREDPMQPERLENSLERHAKRQLVVRMHYHCQQLGVKSLDLCLFFSSFCRYFACKLALEKFFPTTSARSSRYTSSSTLGSGCSKAKSRHFRSPGIQLVEYFNASCRCS